MLDKARSKVDLGALLTERHISRAKLAKLSRLNAVTITAACRGQVIRKSSADAISAALGIPPQKLFEYILNTDHLAVKTVLQHHRFISTVLSQAEKEMIVTYNAAARATLPRAQRKKNQLFPAGRDLPHFAGTRERTAQVADDYPSADRHRCAGAARLWG